MPGFTFAGNGCAAASEWAFAAAVTGVATFQGPAPDDASGAVAAGEPLGGPDLLRPLLPDAGRVLLPVAVPASPPLPLPFLLP